VTSDVKHSDLICHIRVVRCETIEQFDRSEKAEVAMKIEYDTAHDLLNLEFLADVPIHDSLQVDGVVIDYAKDKRIVAIELLDAGKRTIRKPLDLIDLAIVRSRSHAVETEEWPRKKPATFDCGRPVKELRNRSE
jgi:uncharacterized protein YuzE